MNEQELINEAYEAANGGFKIPGKWYPDVSKWEDTSITEFFKTSYPDGAPTKGYIQQLQDINKMEQDERKHDWKGQWERKLKQDKFNAEHPSKPLPKKAPPKISKRSWLTKRLPEVEYVSMENHLNDTIGDSQAYAWSSSNTSVATVSGGTTNTTTATGKAEGKANIIAKLTTTDSEGKTGTSQGQATLTVTAAPPVEKGTLTPANCSNDAPTSFDITVGQNSGFYVTLDLDEEDDGTYTYYWYLNGNGTSLGTIYTDDSRTTQIAQKTPLTGTNYSKVYFSAPGTIGKTGSIYWAVQVVDKQGNMYASPSSNKTKGTLTNTNTITLN